MANRKIVGLEVLISLVKDLKQQGKKIVYAHGAFDLLHTGHIYHLEEAKKLGDILIVTITADRLSKKGRAGLVSIRKKEPVLSPPWRALISSLSATRLIALK